MKEYIANRVLMLADYIIETGATVRSAAKKFGISKSTVHKDIVERLPHINKSTAEEARKILNANKAERHIRGGEATKNKYSKNKHEI